MRVGTHLDEPRVTCPEGIGSGIKVKHLLPEETAQVDRIAALAGFKIGDRDKSIDRALVSVREAQRICAFAHG